MDTLSRLLSLYPMRGSLDVRCHFRAPWIIDHPAAAPGVVPYHLVLSGTAWLDVSDETATPLNMGDVALFPRGRAHRLYTGAPADASPSRVVPSVSSLMQRVNDGDGPVTDVLCGEFAPLSGAPNAMVAALPDTVVIRGDAHASGIADLRALIDMLRKETETPRPGSDTVVSQLASVLFALLIRAWLEQAPAESGSTRYWVNAVCSLPCTVCWPPPKKNGRSKTWRASAICRALHWLGCSSKFQEQRRRCYCCKRVWRTLVPCLNAVAFRSQPSGRLSAISQRPPSTACSSDTSVSVPANTGKVSPHKLADVSVIKG